MEAEAPQATTVCTFSIAGLPDSTGLADDASIECTGPGIPVPITGVPALQNYASTFQGVAFTSATSDVGAYLQFTDIPEVSLRGLLLVCLPMLQIATSLQQHCLADCRRASKHKICI